MTEATRLLLLLLLTILAMSAGHAVGVGMWLGATGCGG